MRRLSRLLFVLIAFTTLPAHADEVPDYDGFVTDKVGLLPPSVRDGLEGKLTAYEKTTSIEVAVLVVPTLGGDTESDYAGAVWRKWHVGKKGQDNGVLLLIVPPPEKKAWIQTGYGIQGWLTDVGCKHVVTDVMRPLNLQGKRAEAVVAGVDAIISKLGATPWAERANMTPPKDDQTMTWVWIGLIVLFLLLAWLLSRRSRSGSGYLFYGGGGDSGSGGGGSGFSFGGGDSGGGGGGGDSG